MEDVLVWVADNGERIFAIVGVAATLAATVLPESWRGQASIIFKLITVIVDGIGMNWGKAKNKASEDGKK